MFMRLKVLISAFSCYPGAGSEPGIGWAVVREMARYHDLWVLTWAPVRPLIEAELGRNPIHGVRFVYWDVPWRTGEPSSYWGWHTRYYLWQLGILRIARALHAQVRFDMVHHVTFGRYSTPSFLCFLGAPLLWGPVGGGESAPKSFWSSGGWRSLLFEATRELARWVAEQGPYVRATARRSAFALATSDQSAARLRALGCRHVEIVPQNGLLDDELAKLGAVRSQSKAVIRFLSVGRLLAWKGYDLGLRAFSRANIADSEYWLIGDGADQPRLEELATKLGVSHKVRFCGRMPRRDVLSSLQSCDVLLHPSLHDSGGSATIEAMAAGLPVICLDLGGPALQVTADCGFKIPARNPDQASRDIATAMQQLAQDEGLRQRLGRSARERVNRDFAWSSKAALLNTIYERVAGDGSRDPSRNREVSAGRLCERRDQRNRGLPGRASPEIRECFPFSRASRPVQAGRCSEAQRVGTMAAEFLIDGW
jgi:glycosyltransferase involved in cell wall biosynthesis